MNVSIAYSRRSIGTLKHSVKPRPPHMSPSCSASSGALNAGSKRAAAKNKMRLSTSRFTGSWT